MLSSHCFLCHKHDVHLTSQNLLLISGICKMSLHIPAYLGYFIFYRNLNGSTILVNDAMILGKYIYTLAVVMKSADGLMVRDLKREVFS